jgi:hypothetical protein
MLQRRRPIAFHQQIIYCLLKQPQIWLIFQPTA